MKKESHNGIISFWKFMFSILICAFHSGTLFKATRFHFAAGSIGVEFFFIVSGYLFYKKCLKYEKKGNSDIYKDNLIMTWNRIKRFFPYVLFLIVTSFLFSIFALNYKKIDFVYSLYNVLLLPVKNVKISLPYGVLWYVSVLIICQFILFPIVVKNKEKYSNYIAPIIVFLLVGYILIQHGNLIRPWVKDVFTYKSVVRGIMEINLGIFIYSIVEIIKKVKFNNFSCLLLTIIEVLGYVSIFFICNMTNAHIKFDVLMLMIFALCITISFSTKSLLYNFSNNKIFYYLEKISLPMYINQWFIVLVVQFVFQKLDMNISYYLFLLVTVLLSILIAIIELWIVKIYEKKKDKLRNLFIYA